MVFGLNLATCFENHDKYNVVPLSTRSACIAKCEKPMSYKRASKKDTIYQFESLIQALHGVAFHSEEDAAMYPQSPANSVAPASNDFKC